MKRMMARLAVAATIFGCLAGMAAAAPIVAKDSAGQTYILNDDGTYGILATTDDNRSFILRPDGHWQELAETAPVTPDPGLMEQLTTMIAAWVEAEGRDMSDDAKATVRSCIADAVSDLSLEALQEILKGSDFEDGAETVIREHPEMVPGLNEKLDVCF